MKKKKKDTSFLRLEYEEKGFLINNFSINVRSYVEVIPFCIYWAEIYY